MRSTKMAPEMAATHIKVTRPPCLLWLLPCKNISRSKTLINRTWVIYSWEKLHDFTNPKLPTLINKR